MKNQLAEKIYVLFNCSLALFFITLGAPVFIVLSIAVIIADGFPVFYRGARMGQHKKTYYMFKFRTLIVNAEAKIGARVLSEKMAVNQSLEHRFGRFLRNSRLDELPQLFNIVRGEMNFVGPRPVRQLIYQRVSREIPGYDRRFKVKPGLLGVSQVFTPHSTPKRLRAKIDYMFVARKEVDYVRELYLIFLVVYAAIRQTILETIKRTTLMLRKKGLLGSWKEKRIYVRRQYANTPVYLSANDALPVEINASLKDINLEMCTIQTNEHLSENETYQLCLKIKVARKSMHKKALIKATVVRERSSKDPNYAHAYLMKYEAISDLNHYRVHQYFLRGSFF